jgi:hypothetical protein
LIELQKGGGLSIHVRFVKLFILTLMFAAVTSSCKPISEKDTSAIISNRLDKYDVDVLSINFHESSLSCLFAEVTLSKDVYEKVSLELLSRNEKISLGSDQFYKIKSLNEFLESDAIDPEMKTFLSAAVLDVKNCMPREVFHRFSYKTSGALLFDHKIGSGILLDASNLKRAYYFAGGI